MSKEIIDKIWNCESLSLEEKRKAANGIARIIRKKEAGFTNFNSGLGGAFFWKETKEGQRFWKHICLTAKV